MKKKLSILTLSLTLLVAANAQFSLEYFKLAQEAKALYNKEDFLAAGLKFSEAFIESGDMVMRNDRYDAALSYAMAGQKDSAFIQLNFLANRGQDDSYRFKMEERLNSLHEDARWLTFIQQLNSNHAVNNKGLNQVWVHTLDTVLYFDQQFRTKLEYIKEKYGANSKGVDSLWNLIELKNSENVKIVSELLDQNGWMGQDVIGSHTITVFLVIQHANLEVQEDYLPMFIEARDRNELDPGLVAMLEDRINMRNGKPQLYGTQVVVDENGQNKFYEIFESENVNARRNSVGLGDIEDYALMFGIEW